MALVWHDDMIQQFPSQPADEALSVRILLRLLHSDGTPLDGF